MGEARNSTEELFLAYLGELDSDESFDLAELRGRHPEKASELAALHDDWKRLRPLLGADSGARSVHVSLRERLGLEADPTVSLPDTVEHRGTDASALLDTLTQRVSSKSRYRLVGEIARGGMGVILKVWDGDLRRHLAMKVILGRSREGAAAPPPTDARMISRFLEEAQVTGQLDHPAIVPVHELGLSPEGRVYFTMRLVRGSELSQIYELAWAEEDGWSQTRALGVLLRACEAVAFAHAKGVVHRDLKPENVMVGRFGEVYVMDWGLARVVGDPDRHDLRLDVDAAALSGVITDRSETPTSESPLKTMDGDIIGTPTFMAPEQALGHLAQIGPHSDVYALGSMLYHLLARTPPYVRRGEKTTQREVLTRLTVGPPAPLSELAPRAPQELVSICEKAMARSPEERYPSVQELSEDLRAFLENRVVRAHATGPVVELRKWVSRNRGLAAASAAALALALGGAIVVAAVSSRANRHISAMITDLELMNLQYEKVTGGLENARTELKQAIDESALQRAEITTLEEQRSELQNVRDELKTRTVMFEGMLETMEMEVAKRQEVADMLEAQIMNLQKQLESLKAEQEPPKKDGQ